MDILIEVNGTITVPEGVSADGVCSRFLDRVESKDWYFGGGFHDGTPISFGGTVYSLQRDLTAQEVGTEIRNWCMEQGWELEARFLNILETEDLLLRPAEYDDWQDMYHNFWRHEECARYMLWDVTPSEEEARARIERTIRYQQNGGLSFIITHAQRPIGFAGVIEVTPGVYEDTGGCIGPEFQRRGFGKQTLEALERFVFSRGAERFIVACRQENIPSQRTIRSRGFTYTHSENRETYILDFYEKRRCDMEVKITYHGHACFTLEYQGARAVIDPYAWGMVPGAADLHLEAEAVYCSHGHGDHNFVEAVKLNEGTPLPWTVQEFVTPHDDCGGSKRGMNTVRIFDFGGVRVAHLGDIGCFPDEALEEALVGVDCMLIPVGGYYTIGVQTAYQIIHTLKPNVAIPMHYRTDKTGFDEISHIDDFCKLFNEVHIKDSPFVLTKDAEKQILILE